MKNHLLSLTAATLLGLSFSGCEITIVPPEDEETKKVETNLYDDYTPEQLQELGAQDPVAPITDLIGRTFYTLDLNYAMYGEAYYSIATINHLDSPDGIVSEDYMLQDGVWIKDEESDEEDGSYEIYEIQGDKLHITGEDCYYDDYSSEKVCEEYENDIYIIDKQADEWIIQITYSSNDYYDTMIQTFFFNEPAEVQDPSLIQLGNETYNDYYPDYNYDDYDQDPNYNDDSSDSFESIDYSSYTNTDLLALRYSFKLKLESSYLDSMERAYYEHELEKINAEIDSRESSAAKARVQRSLRTVHNIFR